MSVDIVDSPKKRKRLSIEDVLSIETVVPISDDTEISIRPLTLTEMLNLFIVFREPFLDLFGQYSAQGAKDLNFANILLVAPEMCARIIALSTSHEVMNDADAEEVTKKIYRRMAGSVQLIALKAIWEVSVPDPKKLGELLSGVMEQLRKLQDSVAKQREETPLTPVQKVSPEASPTPSNSSLPTGTESTT